MKITRSQLRQAIREELQELNESTMPDDSAHNVTVDARAKRMISKLESRSDMGMIKGALIFILQNMKFKD